MLKDFSIIIPFYNANKFVKQSLKNTFEISKKNSNVEIIYVNNNSKDNSYSKIKNKIKNLKNFKIFTTNKKKGMGPGIARNLGIKKSNSKFLTFLDIDDSIEPNNIDKLIEYCKKFKGNFFLFETKSNKNDFKNLNYNNKNIRNFFRYSNNMHAIAKVYKKKYLVSNNLIFPKGIFEDIFFTFKCHFFNKKKVGFVKEILYVKKKNLNSITLSKKTFKHIYFKFNAFKSIEAFLKKKDIKLFRKIYMDIQYRFRGEFSNEYNEIIKLKLKKSEKEVFVNYLKKLYKNSIDKRFKVITLKDKITKKILFNV